MRDARKQKWSILANRVLLASNAARSESRQAPFLRSTHEAMEVLRSAMQLGLNANDVSNML
jgi:hypothetical protein